MFIRGNIFIALACVCLTFWNAESVLVSTQGDPTVLQLASLSQDGSYLVLSYDQSTGYLVFRPPSAELSIFKRTWRDSSSSLTYVSLQVSAASLLSQTHQMYITRKQANPPVKFDAGTTFQSAGSDARLFLSKCCGCGNQLSFSTFYWPGTQTGTSGTTSVLTTSSSSVSASVVTTLSLMQAGPSSSLLCQTSGLQLAAFPFVVRKSRGQAQPDVNDASPGVAVRVFTSIPATKEAAFVSVETPSQDNYILSMTKYRRQCLKPGPTVFILKEYTESSIAADGFVRTRDAVTLKHKASGRYLVPDILDTMEPNVGPGLSGLKLQNESDFEYEIPGSPDGRFFIKYTVKTYGSDQVVLCPIFYRSFCIVPSTNGVLRLGRVHVYPQESLRTTPTLVDPDDELPNFLANWADKNGNLPTLYFQESRTNSMYGTE